MKFNKKNEKTFVEKVIRINRVSKTTQGGRTMSFSTFSATGDKGYIGIGLGKARNVADAIKKSVSNAKKQMIKVSITKNTIPHEVTGHYGATKVFMKPAPEGTGLVAGSAARDIFEAVGISNIYSKVYGSKNKINVARATLDGLNQLRSYHEVLACRGKKITLQGNHNG